MDFFEQMQADEREANREQQQLSFQERIVKQFLRRANIALSPVAAKAEAQHKYGSADLDFRWFHAEYPSFPVRLMSQKLKYKEQPLLAALYGKGQFKKLAWWLEFEEQTQLYGVNLQTDRAALLFNLPYAKDAFLMVLHNQPVQATDPELRDDAWPRTIFPIGKTGLVAVLESFDSFLQTVGTSWAESL